MGWPLLLLLAAHHARAQLQSPQAPATDGAGAGLVDPVAIVWLAFCVVLGAPLALAGVRLGRVTTALGCALITAAFGAPPSPLLCAP
jgi:hypothetical protein